jgi:hypothetical protein
VFLRRPDLPANESALSPLTRGLSWTAVVTNAALVIFMIRLGGWLDTASPLLSMITLGGHHRVVLAVATAALLLLGWLAPTTGGFARADRVQQILLPVAGLLSLVALAGVLSVAGLGLIAVAIAAVLFRPHPGARIDVRHRR